MFCFFNITLPNDFNKPYCLMMIDNKKAYTVYYSYFCCFELQSKIYVLFM